MNITNGTVTRSYKVADYETRTVQLSFTVESGDDADTATGKVMYLCEKHARNFPAAPTAPVSTGTAAVTSAPETSTVLAATQQLIAAESPTAPPTGTEANSSAVGKRTSRKKAEISATTTSLVEPTPSSVSPAGAIASPSATTSLVEITDPYTDLMVPAPEPKRVSGKDLTKACNAARDRGKVGDDIKALIAKFTGEVGKSVVALQDDQDKARAFLDALAAL